MFANKNAGGLHFDPWRLCEELGREASNLGRALCKLSSGDIFIDDIGREKGHDLVHVAA